MKIVFSILFSLNLFMNAFAGNKDIVVVESYNQQIQWDAD